MLSWTLGDPQIFSLWTDVYLLALLERAAEFMQRDAASLDCH